MKKGWLTPYNSSLKHMEIFYKYLCKNTYSISISNIHLLRSRAFNFPVLALAHHQ